MNKLNLVNFGTLFFAATVSFATLPGCGIGSAPVSGTGETFDRSPHKLAFGAIYELDGSFGAGCLNRSGNWSVPIVPLASQTYPSLTVDRANTSCRLTLDLLRIGPNELAASSFVADVPLLLDSAFAGQPVAFRQVPGGPVSFYANARLTPDASFTSDFMVEVLYADDPGLLSTSVTANYAVVSATAALGAIPVPDYSVDVTPMNIQVDGANVVSAAAGQVNLLDNAQPGDSYVVSSVDLGPAPNYGEVDAQFLAGTPVAVNGANPMIPADAFALLGTDLTSPAVRDIILAHTVAGARSYQVVSITFFHP